MVNFLSNRYNNVTIGDDISSMVDYLAGDLVCDGGMIMCFFLNFVNDFATNVFWDVTDAVAGEGLDLDLAADKSSSDHCGVEIFHLMWTIL